MGVGGALFATLALLGLVTLLLQVEWLYMAFRVLGGLYLVILGVRIWRGASKALDMTASGVTRPMSTFRSFALGFATQVSNPKTAIVYASIFAAFLPTSAPSWLFIVLPPLVLALETGWYALVAVVLSSSGPRALYLRFKTWLDRTAGAIVGALGVRLAADTLLSRTSG